MSLEDCLIHLCCGAVSLLVLLGTQLKKKDEISMKQYILRRITFPIT